jgi:hypothetical protein
VDAHRALRASALVADVDTRRDTHVCGVPHQIPFEDDKDVGVDFAACKAAMDTLAAAARTAGKAR